MFLTVDTFCKKMQNMLDTFPTPLNCRTLLWTLFWSLFNDFSKFYTGLEWPTIKLGFSARWRLRVLLAVRRNSFLVLLFRETRCGAALESHGTGTAWYALPPRTVWDGCYHSGPSVHLKKEEESEQIWLVFGASGISFWTPFQPPRTVSWPDLAFPTFRPSFWWGHCSNCCVLRRHFAISFDPIRPRWVQIKLAHLFKFSLTHLPSKRGPW